MSPYQVKRDLIKFTLIKASSPPIEPHTIRLENQIRELKNSIETAEAEYNKYQQEISTLKQLLRMNGIPFVPTPATAERA